MTPHALILTAILVLIFSLASFFLFIVYVEVLVDPASPFLSLSLRALGAADFFSHLILLSLPILFFSHFLSSSFFFLSLPQILFSLMTKLFILYPL